MTERSGRGVPSFRRQTLLFVPRRSLTLKHLVLPLGRRFPACRPYHIIFKHVGEGKDFLTIDEARQAIEAIIRLGEKIKNNRDKVIYELSGKRVVVRKNLRDKASGKLVNEKKKWVVTSYDNNVPKSDKLSASTLTTPESDEGGRAVASDAVS